MEPIDVRADTAFAQALLCVEYRLPPPGGFKAPGYIFALGMRYGLIGMAASHHLLVTSEVYEEIRVLATIDCWPDFVEDHLRAVVGRRLPFATNSSIPDLVGRVAGLPLRSYLPLYRRLCPLSSALKIVADAICRDNRAMIFEGWPWFRRKAALRVFEASVEESKDFAMHFFERREADLEEVPEIALIGE
ncbi:MAG TPA: hypothetical protein VHE55_01425 [Fimbriimonadaceae bacterium]|nr:hypothetical protein [Fimbriimonadaceae bacterium]